MDAHTAPASADDETYLTVDELGAKLRVTPTTIRRLIRAGRIPAMRIGSQYRIAASFKMPEYQPQSAHCETA